MIAANCIIERLIQRWQRGESQLSIAKKAGISQAYLCDLFSGKASADGLTIKKINSLFPKATLLLDGDSVSIRADHNKGTVVGVNRDQISTDCLTAAITRIVDSKDLSDVEKIKVIKVLKK